MTEGLRRFYGGNDLHFLIFSCCRRWPLFRNEAYCDLFLKILERVRQRYRLVVQGYVVMPEYVHLLVSEPQRETLSTAIQALKLGFVRSLEGGEVAGDPTSRKRSEKWGTPIFHPSGPTSPNRFRQSRFYDFNVWTEKKRIEKLRYIHRNPVTRGQVSRRFGETWDLTKAPAGTLLSLKAASRKAIGTAKPHPSGIFRAHRLKASYDVPKFSTGFFAAMFT
jgi:putative transposase